MQRVRRRPGENRDRLIEAAITEFSQHGYHGAATATIARLAGVAQPNVYANFRSKHELLLACLRRILEETATGESEAHRRTPVVTDCFVFQVIAALGEPQLRVTLTPLLAQLRELLGDDNIATMAARAATHMVDTETMLG